MRKWTAITLVLLMVFSLVACSGTDAESNATQGGTTNDSALGGSSTPAGSDPESGSSAKNPSSASNASSASHSSSGGASSATSINNSASQGASVGNSGASSTSSGNSATSSTSSGKTSAVQQVESRYRVIRYHLANGGTFDYRFDTDYWKMPYAREDDGTFTRDGYVLVGYSFNKDGTGELIRPGYKFSLPTGNTYQDLYCVWAKETKSTDFKTAAQSDGTVYITAYQGSDKVVYIPRKIGGKTVSGIAAGAFSGNKALTEVHITSSVSVVENKAFASCSNLKTVTVYDNLKTISDASFTGSTVKTVRLCAGQLPRYIKSMETFGKKYERLIKTTGQKRIIVLAGSSVQYGVETPYMESLFEGTYAVINFGTNGNMNVPFFLDAISPFLTKNDVVVFTPEQYGSYAYHVNGNPELPSATFQGLATCYNLLEKVNVSDYINVFDGIGQYCAQSARMPALSWENHSTLIDQYGDFRNLTSKMNSSDFCKGSNDTFRFNNTVIPAEYIPNLNRIIDKAGKTGAKILFGYPPVNKNNIEESSLNDKAYDSYNQWIRNTVHCPLISDVRNYIYNGEYFYNTDYHLNAVGRRLNTKQLAQDIIAAGVGVK